MVVQRKLYVRITTDQDMTYFKTRSQVKTFEIA